MSSLTDSWADAAGVLPNLVGLSGTVGRFARFGGVSAGGDVDGVFQATNGPSSVRPACPGAIAAVEAGGSFSSGTNLTTDSVGRAVAAGAGDVVVARALESAGAAGVIVKIVFASGR